MDAFHLGRADHESTKSHRNVHNFISVRLPCISRPSLHCQFDTIYNIKLKKYEKYTIPCFDLLHA